MIEQAKLRDWVSILTNIGLLLGIILVVYELRQNSIQMESAAYQDRTTALIAQDTMITESEHLAQALSKLDGSGCEVTSLTPVERTTYHAWLRSHAHRMNNLLYQYSLGVLDDDYMRFIRRAMGSFNNYWTNHGIWQGTDVVREYNDLGFDVAPAELCESGA